MCAVLVTSFIMHVAYSEVFSDHSFYVYYSIIACSSFLILLNLQGHFFRQKASEADRKSAEKLVKTRLVCINYSWSILMMLVLSYLGLY